MQQILVIDDDPDLMTMLGEALGVAGFGVTFAHDGETALAACTDHKPDLVILDLLLPRMDGYAVCKCLRADREYDDVPIIVLTALSEPSDRVAGLECGADDYIVKPFNLDELYARIESALRERRRVMHFQHREAEYARLAAELIRSEEQMRAQVAADLHDTVVQTLVAARMLLDEVSESEQVGPELSRRAGGMVSALGASLSSARRLMRGLRPMPLEAENAVSLAVSEVVEAARDAGIDVDIAGPDELPPLHDELATVLYRIVEEATANVIRHAKAARVKLRFGVDDEGVSVIVEDNGVGFDTAAVSTRRFGLMGMEARAEMLGGTFRIISAVGAGTEVHVWLPLHREEVPV